MKYLSERFSVIAVCMPKAGFLKTTWYDEKITTLYSLNKISCKIISPLNI